MATIPLIWKQRLARWIAWKPLTQLMRLGIFMVVPRHRIGVSVVVLDKDGRILLLKHVFHPTMPWSIPGGWLGRGEAPLDGIHRELLEETGFDVAVDDVIHINYTTDPRHIEIIYVGRFLGGREQLSAEILEARWFSSKALPELYPSNLLAINKALAYRAARETAVASQL